MRSSSFRSSCVRDSWSITLVRRVDNGPTTKRRRTGERMIGTSNRLVTPLTDHYDAFLFDLDGVVYRGTSAVPHAVDSLVTLHRLGKPSMFVTNNAFRTPAEVAGLLRSLSVPAAPSAVVTSAEAAARVLAEELSEGDPVLVIGSRSLETALRHVGLRPTRSADDSPAALVQGWAPDVDWHQLAEGTYALAEGIPWLVTNADLTVPKERGLAPGNGALVAAIQAATDREPRVIGKPEPALFREAIRRTRSRRALVIGDQLNTDIAGAVRAGLDSALVLSGATSASDLIRAPESQRPTYVCRDLRDLLVPYVPVDRDGAAWCCGEWRVRVSLGRVSLDRTDKRESDTRALRALCHAVWHTAGGEDFPGIAAQAANRWSELTRSPRTANRLDAVNGSPKLVLAHFA